MHSEKSKYVELIFNAMKLILKIIRYSPFRFYILCNDSPNVKLSLSIYYTNNIFLLKSEIFFYDLNVRLK